MATVDSVKKEVDDLRGALQIYEEQQKAIMTSMETQVQTEVKTVTANLDMLYRETQQALNALVERVKKLEEGGGGGGKKKESLIHAKSIVPDVLSKDEFSKHRIPTDATAWFTARDADNNGVLSRAEFITGTVANPPQATK